MRSWTSSSRGPSARSPSTRGRSKFTPQPVGVLLGRYFTRGSHVLDPFAGSGTTLVQALESGLDATGVELAAFNCLLIGVKTAHYELPLLREELNDVYERI